MTLALGARPSTWRPFGPAAGAAVLVVVVFAVWTGTATTNAASEAHFDELMVGIVALVAALSCGLAARRPGERLRRAWTFMGASAAIWGLGKVIASIPVLFAPGSPLAAASDIGYLVAIPLAAAAVLAVPTSPSRVATRLRTYLDGGTVALSLFFVSYALGLAKVWQRVSSEGLASQVFDLAHPAGAIVVGTLVVLAIRRTTSARRGQLVLLLAGLAVNSIADSAISFLPADGYQGQVVEMLDTVWVAGYLLIAVSPLWPIRSGDAPAEEGPVALWQVAVPWLALVAVVITAAIAEATGRGLDRFAVVPGGGLVILLMASQLLTYEESLSLLAKSRRAEARLGERTTLLNQVIANAPLGIARAGADMMIIDVNPGMAALLRTKPSGMVGSPVSRFLEPEEFARVFEVFQPLWKGEVGSVESDSNALRADGTRVWLHWTASAVRKPSGQIDYFLVMFDDTTAKHDAEAAAMANLAGLERLNRLKSEFVSIVSHEFRTALTGIQGFSEVLRDEELPSAEVRAIGADINTDAVRLNRLINDMLDLDRIEAGRMALEIAPVDLNGVIREAVGRTEAAGTVHAIATRLDPSLPSVPGDRDRLYQVLTNLLTNAVKYSPGGGEILVTSRVEDGQVEIGVRDHGRGIPPEFVSRLFGRYERYENQGGAKIIGTGLGLALSRQIVELHGGRIWVESKLGEGSDFRFTLPIRGH